MADLTVLQQSIGYFFCNRGLLRQALTHPSMGPNHNQRLEFLGDAVLELCISDYLYRNYPKLNEGKMTRARAVTVCEDSLNTTAKSIGIQYALLLGHGEENSGGREKPSIVSDAMEAVIGAVYLDGGYENASNLILRLFEKTLQNAVLQQSQNDYKTSLQEYVQKRHLGEIEYRVLQATGPEHNKQFEMQVLVSGTGVGCGIGRSKQEAGQQAAKIALESLRNSANEGK